MEDLKSANAEASEISRIEIRWMPGHIEVEGNKKADSKANEARSEDQREIPINMNLAKATINRKVRYKPV